MDGITFIAADLDGTLLRDDHTLSEYTKDVWRRLYNRNIYLVPATGRPFAGIRDVIPMEFCEYLVSTNGVHIYKKDENDFILIRDESMEMELFLRILSIKREYAPTIHMHWYSDDGNLYSFGMGKEIEEYTRRVNIRPHFLKNIDRFSGKKISKVMFIAEHKGLLALQKFFLQEKDLTALFSMPTYLEVFKRNASKAQALSYIMNIYWVHSDDALAIGDSFNDVSMFEICKYSYVMKNAMSKVAPAIPRTKYDNNNDGAARLFEKLFL